MKKELPTNLTPDSTQSIETGNTYKKNTGMNRRKFVEVTAAAALGLTIVPRSVLGGKNYIAPSDKINLAYIGVGTQGIRELLEMLAVPEIQVVAVCDPNKEARGYRDWAPNWLQYEIRKAINKPDWSCGGDNLIPGGRENGRNIVETYYANVSQNKTFKGCAGYADARELLEKEKGVDAVKIMTPDHLHGVLAAAAIKRGKHVLVHKPLSNRLLEAKYVIDLAHKNNNVITHLIPWDSNGSMETVMAWINAGVIGNLKEVHNWTNRPVWPQYLTMPADTPPVPEGFDWDLWLGPEADRPYHPSYTHMVFRGWYDFGGGAMADMGHYSLWTVFNALQLTSPTVVEPHRSHFVDFKGAVPFRVNNNFSFPLAGTVRFKYPANGNRGPVDLYWYDGGMRPAVPDELLKDKKELQEEGLMFVGDSGKIVSGPNVQNPQIISGKKIEVPAADSNKDRKEQEKKASEALPLFVQAVKSGKQYPGSFPEAEYLTEAVNLYAAALRSNKILNYDAANVKISNSDEANKYLKRDYRAGWDIKAI
jgi:hypothetical protein